MTGTTHLSTGAVLGIGLSFHWDLPPDTAIATTAIVMTASVLPDLDTTTSLLGKMFFPVAWLTKNFIGHRTALHSIITWSAIVTITALAFPQYPMYSTALAVGVASHLLLDLLNPAGVMLFWPIPARVGLGICRSGGIVDRWFGRLCLTLTGCEAIHYILHRLVH